jgi:hypothetical protein
MKNTTKAIVSTVGTIMGLGGIEHGIGEILQGNTAPSGVSFASWGDAELFRILAGEPAMSIIPNFLITGILAILFSLIFLVWVFRYVDQKKHGGLMMILLSLVLLLVGGGFAPPLFGIILGAAATRINSPLTWWRTHLPTGLRDFLAKVWPWSFAVCIAAFLYLLPGSILLDYFCGVGSPLMVAVFAFTAIGSLLLTIVAGFGHDSLRQTVLPVNVMERQGQREMIRKPM